MARLLNEVLGVFEELCPLRLAEDWDNVGLLLAPQENASIGRILLTIDLTEPVLAEALALGVDLVLAYHPPLFSGLKRVTRHTASERVVIDALRAGLFVFSPHTALDAASGGINEWLSGLLGAATGSAIVPHPRVEGFGAGRVVTLAQPVALEHAIERVKRGLGLGQVRVAAATRHATGTAIRSFAVCAGAGGSVFSKLREADLLLTGEMRHHDILARVAEGTSVILTDHTNTERGYLPQLAARIRKHLDGLEVHVATADRDPLRIE
jgi:dinuclear metal center YbgI/SA1388 family protein